MKERKSPRTFLEPDMVVDLLDIAGEWEREIASGAHRKGKHPEQCFGRRELIALLCLAGPRIEEAVAGRRGDFDLAGDHWRIPDSKTPAGQRMIELTVYCAEEQRTHVAASPSRGRPHRSRGPMYPTLKGTAMGQGNIRRMLRTAVKRTNERREDEGKMLLPEVTPHTLRRTFASLCFFAGRDPAWVMGQIGHTDARLTLAVYAQTMQRKRVDRALVWSLMRFADEPEEWPGFGPRNGPSTLTLASGGTERVAGA
jgi:integrase